MGKQIKKSKYNQRDEHDIVRQLAYSKIFENYDSMSDSIPKIASILHSTNYRIIAPDITVSNKERNKIEIIYEIEIEETVNIRSIEKWKIFYEKCESFYLIIPQGLKERADNLCAKNGIIAIILEYSIDKEGKIENILNL